MRVHFRNNMNIVKAVITSIIVFNKVNFNLIILLVIPF